MSTRQEAQAARQVTHLQAVRGLGARTACGRSMHGWSRDCPANTTERPHEVTCKKCRNSAFWNAV